MGISHETLDTIILSMMSEEWQKIAVLISKVFDDPAYDEAEKSAQIVAERVYALIDANALTASGNMRRWRECSVKLAEAA